MNTNTPNTDPLDNDEQALARIVRALPAGEPPAALDARILKAASDALATAPAKRRVAWLASGGSLWGIGSAAAAVLAIGIAWQRMNPPLPSLPASAPVPVAQDSSGDGRTPVEFKQEAPRQYDNSPPPPALADAPRSRAPMPVTASNAQTAAAQVAAAPPPAPFPQDAMKESLDEHVADATGRADAEPAALGGAPAAPAVRAETQATAKAAASERDQASGTIDSLVVTGARLSAEGEASERQRVADDAKLYPESWLVRIRTRLKDGDVEGARASLRAFVAKYPTQAIPDDLKILLKE
jgi:hypothetical protein